MFQIKKIKINIKIFKIKRAILVSFLFESYFCDKNLKILFERIPFNIPNNYFAPFIHKLLNGVHFNSQNVFHFNQNINKFQIKS